MVSLRLLAFVAVMAAAALPLSCASSGSSTSSSDIVDFYPAGAVVFRYKNPPRCHYEEVARLSWDRGTRGGSSSAQGVQEGQERRARRKEEIRATYVESGADAILEGPTSTYNIGSQYFFIRFTDPDCRE